MTFELLVIGMLAGIMVFCGLVVLLRNQQDAYIGKRLREAAGSREHIENAISDASLSRLLRRKDEQTDEAIRVGISQLARTDKVLHFPPQLRIVRGGQPLDFPPDGGGEAA